MDSCELLWAQIDLSQNLLEVARSCLARHELHPIPLALEQDHVQLTWSLPGDSSEAPLRAEFVAHEIIRGASGPVHLCLGKRIPRDCSAWIDVSAFRPLRAKPQLWDGSLLLERYQQSGLCAFHQHYFGQQPYTPEQWARSYDRITADELPQCVSPFLRDDYPAWQDDLGLRHFVRSLLGLGWHPRHIAGVMAPRLGSWALADLAARCTAGLLHEGLDRLQDFDCQSICGLGYCPPRPQCIQSLEEVKGHLQTGSWQP